MIADCTGAVEQQWQLNADQTISSVADASLCLATPESEWGVALAPCDASSTSQQWTRG
ncbi:hypothetical protein J2X63_001446 [Agromyces sp. 3263]|uniref:ricin-type beta-trefoil lectin domain protein n=1 Tax=Agromyces sp. 3263 TaxID=2817750 RepID=UPI00286029A2|nr:ricin-type beta-trefoil lectin domain protein [Agromyces sp. 3263]MDR6905760.1 hypothetical protein [Agromyces sp. 3263]